MHVVMLLYVVMRNIVFTYQYILSSVIASSNASVHVCAYTCVHTRVCIHVCAYTCVHGVPLNKTLASYTMSIYINYQRPGFSLACFTSYHSKHKVQ